MSRRYPSLRLILAFNIRPPSICVLRVGADQLRDGLAVLGYRLDPAVVLAVLLVLDREHVAWVHGNVGANVVLLCAVAELGGEGTPLPGLAVATLERSAGLAGILEGGNDGLDQVIVCVQPRPEDEDLDLRRWGGGDFESSDGIGNVRATLLVG